MDESLVSAIVNWLPFIVLVAVFLFLFRKGNAYYKKYDQHVSDVIKVNEELIAINREMAKTLIEIRNLLQTGKS